MSSDDGLGCPAEEEIVALALDEVDGPRKAKLLAHVATCEACSRAYEDHRALVGALSAPPPKGTQEHLHAVVAAARATPQDARGGRVFTFRRAALAVTVVALAAAFAFRVGTSESDPVARGAGAPPARICRIEGPSCLPLVPATKLSPGTRLSLESESRGEAPRFGLAFLVDARGEAHWVFPPWTGGPAPSGAALPQGISKDALQFPTIAPGDARAYVLSSEAPLRVADVEKLSPSERTETNLRAAFPGARLSVIAISVGAP